MKSIKLVLILLGGLFVIPALAQGYKITYDSFMLGCGQYFSKNVEAASKNKTYISVVTFHYCECSLLEMKKLYCQKESNEFCKNAEKNPTKEQDIKVAKDLSALAAQTGVTAGKIDKCVDFAINEYKKRQ